MDTEIAVQRALTDVDREVRIWLGDNDPLPRTGLVEIGSAFKRGVGEGAEGELRAAPAADLGVFAARHDAVLYEFDDDPELGAVIGYPAGENRWVPVLLCASGPAEEAATLIDAFLARAGEAADGEVTRP